MIVIVIGLLRTILSGLYRHRRGLGFTWSRLQGRKYNIRIAKLVFHAKESPIRTRAEVLSLVSSRFNSPDDVYSPAVRIPPNPGLPHSSSGFPGWKPKLRWTTPTWKGPTRASNTPYRTSGKFEARRRTSVPAFSVYRRWRPASSRYLRVS